MLDGDWSSDVCSSDLAAADAAFFPDGEAKSIFLINIGHGDPAALFPRSPRLDFDEMAKIA
jgi:3-hydroxypropanoate dehydrogenase